MSQLYLKWDSHINVIKEFADFLSYGVMVDVTLVCEGKKLQAHKIILSACSPFFRSLLLENHCTHPIVILTDIKYSDLKAIIEFMYWGEITVDENKLLTLIKIAEKLKVKGLGEMRTENNQYDDECDNVSCDEPENHENVKAENNQFGDECENLHFNLSDCELSVCSTNLSSCELTPNRSLHDRSEDEDYQPEIKQEVLSDNESMNFSIVDSAILQSRNASSFQKQQSIHNNSAVEESCETSRPSLLKQLLTINDKQSLKSSSLSYKQQQERESSDPSLKTPIPPLTPCVVVLEDVMPLIRKIQQTKSSSGDSHILQSANSQPSISTPPKVNSSVTELNMPICHNVSQQQNILSMPIIASQAQNMNSIQGSCVNQSNMLRGIFSNAGIRMANISVPVSHCRINPLAVQLGQPETSGQTSHLLSHQSINRPTLMPSAIQSKLNGLSIRIVNETIPQYSQATTSTSNVTMQQSVPGIRMDTNQLNRQQANAPVGTRDRSTIWQGILEFHEISSSANFTTQIVSHTLPCTFSLLSANGNPDLNTDKWPNKLTLHLTGFLQHVSSDNLYTMLQTDANRVLIHFNWDSEALPILCISMSFGRIGYILFPESCNYQMMAVLYSRTTNQFVGFIRRDQKNFFQNIRQMWEKEQKQKLLGQPNQPSNMGESQSSTDHNTSVTSVTSIDESVVDSPPTASSLKKLQDNAKLKKVRKKFVHQSLSSKRHDDKNNVNTHSKKVLKKITNSQNINGLMMKIYKCKMCYFKTVTRGNLKSHINTMHQKRKTVKHQLRLHEKEKPFHCNLCPYKASTHYLLKKHVARIHENKKKPFQCEECDFRTTGRTNLKKHMTTAHRSKAFACIVCSYQSDKIEQVKRHVEEEYKKEK